MTGGFNPRSPCGERLWLSRPPCRRRCFNPRSPCGERHGGLGSASRRVVVSTHAPLAGSDQTILPSYPVEWQFQPTLPLRGATHLEVALVVEELVSTHAPLAGSDLRHEGIDPAGESFNPRSPCGERPEPKRTTLTKEGFNPRSPCGERYHGPQSDPGRLVSTHAPLAGSDTAHQSKSAEYSVSTHAPLAGSDARESRSKALDSTTLPLRGATDGISDRLSIEAGFQPTLPLRGATPTTSRLCSASTFQPTLPLRGATFAHGVSSVSGHVSTHAPLAGSDRRSRSRTFRTGRVSTHAPLAGSDVPVTQLSARLLVSTHAPLAGSDPRGRDA